MNRLVSSQTPPVITEIKQTANRQKQSGASLYLPALLQLNSTSQLWEREDKVKLCWSDNSHHAYLRLIPPQKCVASGKPGRNTAQSVVLFTSLFFLSSQAIERKTCTAFQVPLVFYCHWFSICLSKSCQFLIFILLWITYYLFFFF